MLHETKWAKSLQAFLPCEFSSDVIEKTILQDSSRWLAFLLALSLYRPVMQPTHDELKRGEAGAGEKGRSNERN